MTYRYFAVLSGDRISQTVPVPTDLAEAWLLRVADQTVVEMTEAQFAAVKAPGKVPKWRNNDVVLDDPPPPNYAELRGREYPRVGEQLDMLWHAMDIGQIPKATQWYATIKAVKDKYPKPAGPV